MNLYYSEEHGGILQFKGFHRYVDLDGYPVSKTKEKYPYSYDPYVVWKGDYDKNRDGATYSDRLLQWDYDKYNRCCREVWKNERQSFSERNPKDIEKFLSLYFGKEIELTVLMEGCNVSNGYPYWVFIYRDK